MNDSEVLQAVAFILQDVADDDERAEYEASLLDHLKRADVATGLEAIDRNLIGDGGCAFQWEDFLDISDIWDSLDAVRDSFGPSAYVRLILTLLGAWRKLRAVRIPLTHTQFMVLRAVKRGNADIASIARYTELPDGSVRQAISELSSMRYKRDIPLVEPGLQGFVTQF